LLVEVEVASVSTEALEVPAARVGEDRVQRHRPPLATPPRLLVAAEGRRVIETAFLTQLQGMADLALW
jgi:hypothetical protein